MPAKPARGTRMYIKRLRKRSDSKLLHTHGVQICKCGHHLQRHSYLKNQSEVDAASISWKAKIDLCLNQSPSQLLMRTVKRQQARKKLKNQKRKPKKVKATGNAAVTDVLMKISLFDIVESLAAVMIYLGVTIMTHISKGLCQVPSWKGICRESLVDKSKFCYHSWV